MAAQATLALSWAHAQAEPRARLLGASDALVQTTGAAFRGEPGGQEVVAVRQRLAQDGEGKARRLAAAYREGRALSFGAAAALARRLLAEAVQALPDQEAAPSGGRSPARPSRPADGSRLTAREREVLRLVAQGLSSRAIGRQLFLAPSTVNYHLTAVFNKLGVGTRAQAVAVAAQRGLV
jgi:DNA-binding CsgD family transcriptional regulator